MRFIILVFIIALCSCTPTATVSSQNNSLAALVQSTLGEAAIIIPNQDNSFALCYKQLSAQSVSFIIIRISDTRIVLEDTAATSAIGWHDNLHVEIKPIPGIVKKTEEEVTSKIIDVSSYIIRKQ